MRGIKFRAWHKDNLQMVNDWAVYTSQWIFKANVRGETIPMQFTGMLDKNGIEIYEGDILSDTTYDLIGAVTWKEVIPGFIVVGPKKESREQGAYFLSGTWEIIGNIHENPDLLPVESEKK